MFFNLPVYYLTIRLTTVTVRILTSVTRESLPTDTIGIKTLLLTPAAILALYEGTRVVHHTVIEVTAITSIHHIGVHPSVPIVEAVS